jgi:N-acetylneuraminic acid mutarotase
VALRYAAVASAGRALLIIGGSTPTGASDIVYRFEPASGIVRRLGRMPQPITHAGAAAIGQTVYVVGGRGDSLDARSAAVWAIDPLTGRVRSAGRLPQPISDAGVVSLGDAIVVAGGRTAAGTQSGVGELVPVR